MLTSLLGCALRQDGPRFVEERLEMEYGWCPGPMAFIREPGTAWSLALTQSGDCASLKRLASSWRQPTIYSTTCSSYSYLPGGREEQRKIRFLPLCF